MGLHSNPHWMRRLQQSAGIKGRFTAPTVESSIQPVIVVDDLRAEPDSAHYRECMLLIDQTSVVGANHLIMIFENPAGSGLFVRLGDLLLESMGDPIANGTIWRMAMPTSDTGTGITVFGKQVGINKAATTLYPALSQCGMEATTSAGGQFTGTTRIGNLKTHVGAGGRAQVNLSKIVLDEGQFFSLEQQQAGAVCNVDGYLLYTEMPKGGRG